MTYRPILQALRKAAQSSCNFQARIGVDLESLAHSVPMMESLFQSEIAQIVRNSSLFRNNRSPVWCEIVLDPLLEPAGSSHGPGDKAPPGIWQFQGHSTKVAHDEFYRPWLQRLILWVAS